MTAVGQKVFWTSREAAADLGISVSHLYDELAAGRIRCEQRAPGCRLRFRREHLDAYAAGRDALVDELADRRGTRLHTVPQPRRRGRTP